MSTSLINAFVALTKDIGDYWASTTTGAGTATTLVDASLMAKSNDWLSREAYVILTEEPTGSAAIYDERKASSLDNTTGTLTTLTFAAAPGTGIDYMLTRQFSPTDYKLALIYAAKASYPNLHFKVRDESLRGGQWLIDGGFEIWSSTSALSYWTASTTTLTQTSTARLFTEGLYSCKLSGGAGYVGQSIANNDDLKYLRGKHVRFVGRGWSDTASSLRLAVYDGTDLTYSDYHPGDSAWDDETSTWYVEADISETATEVAFRVYHGVAAATEYIDDLYVTSSEPCPHLYIGHLSLALDRPIKVSYFPQNKRLTPPIIYRNFGVYTDYLDLGNFLNGERLRVEGIGYLDFNASGVVSDSWTATIAVDEPQLRILTAEAARYLYSQMAGAYTTGGNRYALERLDYWTRELERRKIQFPMDEDGIHVKWTV